MTFWLLYIIVILPSVSLTFGVIAACSIIIILGLICDYTMCLTNCKERRPRMIKIGKIAGAIFLVSIIITTILPNHGQMYSLVGGYYVINMEGVSDLPPKVVAAMNTFLDTYNGAEK